MGNASIRLENNSQVGLYTHRGRDRRVGDDASLLLPCGLTILISAATPAPYRYTGYALKALINARPDVAGNGC